MNFRSSILGIALVGAGFLVGCGDKGGNDAAPTAIKDSLSYAYGMVMGNDFAKGIEKGELPIDKAEFVAALKAAFLGDTTTKMLLTEEEAIKVMDNYSAKRREQDANKEVDKEAQWFAQNVDNKPGIQKTASGLRYEVLVEGKGEKPAITDYVTVHYHGTLTDGNVFDSSVQRGETIEFPVNGVIPGWQEALQLMPVGSKWKLYIPFALAYGDRPAGQIPPYSTLIFEVELFKKAVAPTQK